jgi:hypothetical protein
MVIKKQDNYYTQTKQVDDALCMKEFKNSKILGKLLNKELVDNILVS